MARPRKSAAPANESQPVQDEAPKKKRGGQPGNSNSKGHGKGRPAKPKPLVAEAPKVEKLRRTRGGQPGNKNAVDSGGGGPALLLEPTEENFRKVLMLAKLRCTEVEAASAFEVSVSTFNRFLADFSKANEAWVNGAGNFCISLRRKQIQAADAGNVTMLIWLGKQYLGQTDKQQIAGDPERPIKSEMNFKIEFVKNGLGPDQNTTTGSV